MTPSHSKLAVRPERCDRCGACVRACPESLVKIGGGYIYIDVVRCAGCLSCVSACGRGAIERGSAGSGTGGAKAVVGSRAEAKAYKKAAQAAEKRSGTVVKRSLVPATSTAGGDPAGAGAATGPVRAPGASIGARLSPSALLRRSPTADAATDRPGFAWSPAEVVAMLVLAAVAFLAARGALGSTAFQAMPAEGQVIARALILATYYGVQIALAAVLAHRHGMSVPAAFGLTGHGHRAVTRLANVGIVVGLFVATRVFSTAWAAAVRAAGWAPPVVEDAGFSALFGAGVGGLLLTLLAVAVVGPIAEELLYRGAALRMLADRVGPWPAILVTAVLYAGSHVEPWVFVSTFVLGVALGWVAWQRRSLAGAIVLHALYNAIAVGAAYYAASA